MKTTIKLFFLAAIVTLIASCAKNPEKLLVKKDGKWTAISTTTLVGFGTFIDTTDVTFTDGSGTMTDNAGISTPFTWSYDKKAAQITLTQIDGADTYVTVSNVTEIETDSEKWTMVSSTVNGTLISSADLTSVMVLTRK